MKKIMLALCLLSASAAFGQYNVGHLDSQPQIYRAPEHPAHASYMPMAQGQSIVGGGSFAYAQGERPASDFPQPAAVPLGDTARELKQQHAQLKKARRIWEN